MNLSQWNADFSNSLLLKAAAIKKYIVVKIKSTAQMSAAKFLISCGKNSVYKGIENIKYTTANNGLF